MILTSIPNSSIITPIRIPNPSPKNKPKANPNPILNPGVSPRPKPVFPSQRKAVRIPTPTARQPDTTPDTPTHTPHPYRTPDTAHPNNPTPSLNPV
eukprot:1388779-Amorphochlora_amoeboformis.AAC.1